MREIRPKFGNLGLNISAPRAPRAKKFICSESVDQACQYEVECRGMWQGVGACDRVRGSGRGSGL